MKSLQKCLKIFSFCLITALYSSTNIDSASIHTPMKNASNLIGKDISFYCGVSGVQESWEFMQWVKMSPEPAEVIAVDNDTLDDSKYKMSGYYNLTVKNIGINDDSWYSCSMGVEDYEAKLTVSDYPDSCHLYSEKVDGVTNLTCISKNSRPEAIISWFRGDTEITDYAYHPKPDLDSNGYGDTWSILSIDESTGLPGTMHDGYFYTCVIDLPGVPGVFVEDIWIGSGAALFEANRLSFALTTIIAAVLMS